MSNLTGSATFITVTVTLEGSEPQTIDTPKKLGIPTFNYSGNGGNVEFTEAGCITYILDDETGLDLKFVGAAFTTPFDRIVDAVTMSSDGKLLQLIDLNRTVGETSFQFVLSNSNNTLTVLSPDPQIINRPGTK